MIRRLRLAVALLCLANTAPVGGASPLILTQEALSIEETALCHVTGDSSLRAPDLAAREEDFRPLAEVRRREIVGEAIYWLRVEVTSGLSRDETFVVVARKGYFWKMDLTVMDGATLLQEATHDETRSGVGANRLLPRVGLPFAAPAGVPRTLYLRVKAYDIRHVHPTIVPWETYTRWVTLDSILVGSLFGALVALVIYHAILLLSVRDGSLGWYVLYLAATILYLPAARGVWDEALVAVPVLRAEIGSLFGGLVLWLALWLTRRFLRTPRTHPGLDLLIRGYLLLVPVAEALMLLVRVHLMSLIASVLLISAVLVILAAGVVSLGAGRRNARFFVAAFTPVVAGTLLSQLPGLGLRIPGVAYFLVNAEQMGILISALLLSVAVAERIGSLRQESIRLRAARLSARLEAKALGREARQLAAAAEGRTEAVAGPAVTEVDLSQRQREVLDLVIKGYTNREIAGMLGVSRKTIDYHVGVLLERVGVQRRTQLGFELLDRPGEAPAAKP